MRPPPVSREVVPIRIDLRPRTGGYWQTLRGIGMACAVNLLACAGLLYAAGRW